MSAALGGLLPRLLLLLPLLLPSAALPRSGESSLSRQPEPSLLPGAEGRKVQNGSAEQGARGRAGRAAAPGARCPQGAAEEGGTGGPRSRPQPWPLGGLEGPVCRVRMEQDGAGPRHLEVVGVLGPYESGFIRLLRRRRWDGTLPEALGLCGPGATGAAPHPLRSIHEHLLEPGTQRLLVLHLEEGWCESRRAPGWGGEGAGLAVVMLLAGPKSAWVRPPGMSHPRPSVASAPVQRLCLSRDTQYLVLAAAAAAVTRGAEQLRFSASLELRGSAGGAALPRTELQQLLFGSDDKCFTRMTPVLLLLAKSQPEEEEEEEEEALAPSSYLSADGVLDTAPYPQLSPPQGAEDLPSPTAPSQGNASSAAPGGTAQFLAELSRFIRQLLSSSSEPAPQPSAHHWLDFEVMETLPHQLLNLSEEAALERLVQSEEPSVLLFPQDGGAVPEQHLGAWQPEGTVLQLLLGKLRALIQELRDIPAFQANAALFRHLLTFCYYPGEPGPAEAAERGPGSRRLRTLLLLKALQSVRARWQERRKVQRQNRSARPQAHCRLQELSIDLRDRTFIVMPTAYAANNCEGPCRLPLSARVPGYFSHTVLLLGMQERGSTLRRPPCCVPVRYSDQLIISLSSDGLEVRKFPNMVAEECGCR
ncbi:MIS factor, partial [Climacteris rufus]|nr:MIS factor [Climacteris rufus]